MAIVAWAFRISLSGLSRNVSNRSAQLSALPATPRWRVRPLSSVLKFVPANPFVDASVDLTQQTLLPFTSGVQHDRLSVPTVLYTSVNLSRAKRHASPRWICPALPPDVDLMNRLVL
jgi:hypothetical protein